MAENTGIFYQFILKPGHSVKVEGFIPGDSKGFAINLGKDENNYVLHFNPRFNHFSGDVHKTILNSLEDGVWGEERKEPFFPFQEGSNTTVSFKFEQGKITIQLPSGDHLSFPVRFPIEEISYLSLINLQPKSITLN